MLTNMILVLTALFVIVSSVVWILALLNLLR
jgi:hypothetical protein